MFLYFPIILQGLGAGVKVLLHSPIFKTDQTHFQIRFYYSWLLLVFVLFFFTRSCFVRVRLLLITYYCIIYPTLFTCYFIYSN